MSIPYNTKHFKYDDGGRAAAGRKGTAGDCVCRAVAIAAGIDYEQAYAMLAEGHQTQRRSKHQKTRNGKTASQGIYTNRKWFKDLMHSLEFDWTPTMQIGSGCKVHLKADELPEGRLICSVSKHVCAVIDGVVHDTHDPSRDGTRCVYGYWKYVGE